MRIKMELHPAYRHLANWIQRLPDSFGTEGEILVDGRNQVREVVVEGERLVVKYFKRITTANRFVYRYFRASKASRAYRNAQVLLSKGVSIHIPLYIRSRFPVISVHCLFKNGIVNVKLILFSQTLSFQLESDRFMHNPVEACLCNQFISNHVIPVGNRKLTRDYQ